MNRLDVLRLRPATGLVDFKVVSSRDDNFVAACRAHYTESCGAPVGKKICYQILEHGKHRGWIGVGEPAFKLAPRRRLGMLDTSPLPQTISCFIYRLDAEGSFPAYKILRAWHPVMENDWAFVYNWKPIHVETMVDPEKILNKENPGACFRRAGYRPLGFTTGLTIRRPAGHTHGPTRVWSRGNPKLVLYRGPLPRLPE